MTQSPVIVQDASAYVGRPLSVDVLAALLGEHGPERVLFKPEASPVGPRLSALRDSTRCAARVFEGSGGVSLVDNFRRGIAGTMPGADLIDPILALCSALLAGDERRIYRLSLPISALVNLQTGLDGFLAVEKHLLKRQGIFRNTVVRRPIGFPARLGNHSRGRSLVRLAPRGRSLAREPDRHGSGMTATAKFLLMLRLADLHRCTINVREYIVSLGGSWPVPASEC